MSLPRIHVSFWMKPIPIRSCDYIATYDDYEGGDGYDERPGPSGEGATAAQAVLDLIDNHPRGVQCERDAGAVSS
jgi:hypothetical protein